MPRTILLLLLLGACFQVQAQTIREGYTAKKGIVRVGYGKDDIFPMGEQGYTIILPENTAVKGTIISIDDERPRITDSTKNVFLHKEANAKGLAVLYISTGIPVDLFFDNSSLLYTDAEIASVFSTYKLPNKNIFLLGVMTSGHRALKYVEFCKAGKSKFKPDIKGVVLCESAIDWVRQWYEGQKQVRDHLTEVGYFEGKMVTYLFKEKLKADPVSNMPKMLEFSPYSYFDTKMKKMKLYSGLAMRAYSFADIRYWFSTQGKGIYDCNYPDMSGIINEQKLAGNKNAELVVFHSNPEENPEANMQKQSSTWEMADKKELVNWIMKFVK